MRQRRSKTYRKLMRMYKRAFGFREPYQVLIDSSLVTTADACKINISNMLESILQGTVKPMITQCSIFELYKLGAKGKEMVSVAKSWERRRCNHFKRDVQEDKCIYECIGSANHHRYVFASCNADLRSNLRQIPGLPMLYIRRSVAILEPPSQLTTSRSHEFERNKQLKDASHAHLISTNDNDTPTDALADAEASARSVASLLKRKRKGGPNPLSVKKKKRRDQHSIAENATGSSESHKRNRRKVKRSAETKDKLIDIGN